MLASSSYKVALQFCNVGGVASWLFISSSMQLKKETKHEVTARCKGCGKGRVRRERLIIHGWFSIK